MSDTEQEIDEDLGDDALDPDAEEPAGEEEVDSETEDQQEEADSVSAATATTEQEQVETEPASPIQRLRAKLPEGARAKLEAQRQRAADMGYLRSFDGAEAEELPAIVGAIPGLEAKRIEKAEARRQLLRQYPSHRTKADGPPDAA
jgi:hypothetical protein